MSTRRTIQIGETVLRDLSVRPRRVRATARRRQWLIDRYESLSPAGRQGIRSAFTTLPSLPGRQILAGGAR